MLVPRGLEPRTLRLLAARSNQLSYETNCACCLRNTSERCPLSMAEVTECLQPSSNCARRARVMSTRSRAANRRSFQGPVGLWRNFKAIVCFRARCCAHLSLTQRADKTKTNNTKQLTDNTTPRQQHNTHRQHNTQTTTQHTDNTMHRKHNAQTTQDTDSNTTPRQHTTQTTHRQDNT